MFEAVYNYNHFVRPLRRLWQRLHNHDIPHWPFCVATRRFAPNRGEKSEEDKRPLVYTQIKVEVTSTHEVESCLDPNLTLGGYDLDDEFR